MADESLNFKFSLDLSDFDKAPKIIDDALHHIATEAEKQGKNADLAMAKYVQDMIKERENRVAELSKKIEEATKRYSEVFASFQNGQATAQQFDQASKALEQLKDELSQTKDELTLLNEKEKEVSSNATFLNNLRMKAQGMNLYGKAIAMLPAPIAMVVQSSKTLNGALKLLTTNPIVMMLTGLVVVVKSLYEYGDFLADRFDGVAKVFGTVTEAVVKAKNAFMAIISLDWKDLEYNLKNMFNGGEKEMRHRNEALLQAQEEHESKMMQMENHWLRRRINNTALGYQERIEADKKYTENLKKEQDIRKKQLDREMMDFLDSVSLYDEKLNPAGNKGFEDLAKADQAKYQAYLDKYKEIEHQKAVLDDESSDRRARLLEGIKNEWQNNMKWLDDFEKEAQRKRMQFNRSVREQMQSEQQRLKELAQQTENMAIQAQINEMADGIDKVTKQAELKAKQAFESLEKTLRSEAQRLYNNEKSIFESNPKNEGKMFKEFRLEDYIRQAKQNIGYDLRKNLISDDEVKQIKKAVDDIVKHALDGAKKVSKEIGDTIRKVQQATTQNAPSFAGSYESFSLGINDAIKATDEYKSITDELSATEDHLMNLQTNRIGIMMELNHIEDGEKKVELAKELEKIDSNINDELEKAENLLNKQAEASEKVKSAFDKMKKNLSTVASSFGSAFSSLKGISKEMDDTAEALGQMTDMAVNMLEGNVMGAITQVASFIANKLVDNIKRVNEKAKEREEKEKEAIQAQRDAMEALSKSAMRYNLNLIDAKKAQDALYDTTNINSMITAQEKLLQLQDRYKEYTDNIVAKRLRYGETQGKGLNDFVNSLVQTQINGQALRGTQDNPLPNLNDVIKEKYGKALFGMSANGEYELNTEIWKTLDEDSKKMFNEHQIEVIDGIAEIQDQIKEANDEISKGIADWYAPLLDNMADAWMNWLDTGEDVMDSFKDYSANTFRTIVKDMLKTQLYKSLFDDYKEQVNKYTVDYLENQNLDQYTKSVAEETDKLMKNMDDPRFKSILETWRDQLKSMDVDITNTTGRSAEARGIARASQESIDEYNARMAMMQQHTYTINANVAQLVSYSASALEHLSAIHSNTNRLERIEGLLSDIQTYGVRTR